MLISNTQKIFPGRTRCMQHDGAPGKTLQRIIFNILETYNVCFNSNIDGRENLHNISNLFIEISLDFQKRNEYYV